MSCGQIKILQVMPEFGVAGAEIMCENLCKQLYNRGFHIVIVSLYDLHTSVTSRIEKYGIPIIYLQKKGGLDLSLINKLKKIMFNEEIDIVHTHRYTMQYAYPAALLAGVKPCVHTVHNMAKQEVNLPRRLFASLLYKTGKVTPIGISPLVQKSISREYGLSCNKIPMIYNGIDLNQCFLKSDYSTNGIFQFVHVGRFSYQKNHMMMIQAMNILKEKGINCHMNFVGDGELMNDCKKTVGDLGLNRNITFWGIQDDVHSILYASDCFVLPSRYEGMPVSLIEAMGTGLPVIVTNVGGMPDMIENDISGLIVDSSVSELTNAMIKIINDVSYREQLGKNAKVKSNAYSSEKMADEYIKVYDSLLKNNYD